MTKSNNLLADYAAKKQDICIKNDTISDSLFREYGVNRGLRDVNGKGVLTGLTNISEIVSFKTGEDGSSVPCDGQLWYRGYNVKTLTNNLRPGEFGFEKIAYLLLFGQLPSESELAEFTEVLGRSRTLPTNFTRDVIMKAPSKDIMNSMTRSILTLASYDPLVAKAGIDNNIRQCLSLVAIFPMLAVYGYHAYNHYENDQSMRLFPVLLINMILLLSIFYHLDKKAYQKDITKGLMPEVKENEPLIRIKGAHNFLYIVMIVIAVILSGVLPKLSAFQNAAGEVIGIPIFKEVTLTVPAIIEIAIILLAALLSFKTTPKEVRVQNHFTWGAIQEVAVLFIGIFITMQPALMVLKSAGSGLGITEPFEMFWATGALSSFLDNTPTYLVFLTTAGAMHFTTGVAFFL